MKVCIVSYTWGSYYDEATSVIEKVFATKESAWRYIDQEVEKHLTRRKAEVENFISAHPEEDDSELDEIEVEKDYDRDSCTLYDPYDDTYTWDIGEYEVEPLITGALAFS